MKQSLDLKHYEVQVHLGCGEQERKYLQPVRFSLTLEFSAEIKGALTDELSDTVDYVELTQIIQNTAKLKPYRLIEHLGLQVFTNLLTELRLRKVSGTAIFRAQKLRVPVENLKNGVVFQCTETI